MKAKALTTQKELNQLGASIATSVTSMVNNYNATRINIVLETVAMYVNDVEKTKHILQGYYDGYVELLNNEAVARARKSEFKAVFDCVAKTMVTGENLKALQSCTEYQAMVKLARQLRDVGKLPKESSNVIKPLNDNQVSQIENDILRANSKQVETITTKLVSTLSQFSDDDALTGIRQLRLINSIASNMLNVKGLDKATVKLADEITKLVSKHLDKVATSKAVESVGGVYDEQQAVAVAG